VEGTLDFGHEGIIEPLNPKCHSSKTSVFRKSRNKDGPGEIDLERLIETIRYTVFIHSKEKKLGAIRVARRGPLPRFSDVHIRRVLDLIRKYEKIGRKQLVEEIGIGEGSMRTILNRLKRRGLIASSRGGHALTSKGKRFLGKPFQFVQIDAGPLTVGEVDVATVVRGAAEKVKRGIEQRDEAIKVGADGATVLVYKGGKLRFPDGFMNVEKKLVALLTKIFEPREGDVIIVGTAKDVVKAEEGARAAARSLA
jgi:predicted transcriptional regulator